MASSIGIILAHDDRSVAEAVTEAIEQAPDLFVAATTLDASAGSVVVAGDDALVRLESSERPVVALATHDLVRVARAALACGAADIVRWPEESERLADAIRAAAQSVRATAAPRGRVVAVASARGGTGASTFAALLARSLGAVVLDLAAGQRAFASDNELRTLDDLRVPLTEVTADALESLAAPHPAGRAVHASALGDGLPVAAVHAVVRAMRDVSEVCVVDVGTCATAGLRAAASAADTVVLVAADDVASVRRAASLSPAIGNRADALRSDAGAPARGLLVVRRRRRGGIALRDLRSALGNEVAVVRDDSSLARAVDLGTLPSRPSRTARAADHVAAALRERWS